MNGAECLLRALVANGVEVCFMNPGTSEMRFVEALDKVPEMRGILCLYEGVCSGAADGYARMTNLPASVLLHLGPGLANALSNLHNARKARQPVLAIVGEHSTPHRRHDAPLSSDIAAIARTVSHHVGTVSSSDEIGPAVRDAVAASLGPPGKIAALIVPADFSWSASNSPIPVASRPPPRPPSGPGIEEAARILSGRPAAGFILGGTALADPRALDAAGRIAAATGARFFGDRVAPRNRSGRGCFPIGRVPYFPEQADAALAGLSHLFLIEALEPVSFFGYADTPSSPVPKDCSVSSLAAPGEDGPAALERLAADLGARHHPAPSDAGAPVPVETGPLTLDSIGRTLAALLPEGAIVSDEMVSARDPVIAHLFRAVPHDQLTVTGGSIGQGLPVAVGAAVACPGRKVFALEADGSAMYSFQALWTMARENLDVLTIVFANRRYGILDIEMRRTGAGGVGPRADAMLDIGRPEIDFVGLARGLGVPATRAADAAEFAAHLRDAVGRPGPRLIEAVIQDASSGAIRTGSVAASR